MSSKVWYGYLEGTIYTRVKDGLQSSYGTVSCTTEEQNATPSELPTVEIRELDPIEQGQDLYNVDVAAVLETIQIRIFASSRADCKKLSRLVTTEMKTMHFNIVKMFSVGQVDTDVYLAIGRFRRIIAAGDSDIVVN